jgi:hypothetical protein
MNIDALPMCCQMTMFLWLARFLPRLARIDLPDPGVGTLLVSPWVWLGILLLVALLLFARPSGTLRAAVLVGAEAPRA